mgnify:CR=1 FL=1
MKKFKFRFKNLPIFLRLSIVILLVFLLTIGLFLMTSFTYRKEKQEELYRTMNSGNQQAISKIDDYINDISNITKLPLTYKQADKEYMSLLYNFSTKGENTFTFQLFNEQIFEEIFTYKKSVNSCFIFNPDGVGDYKVHDPIYQPFNPSKEDWFSECIDAFGKPVLVDTYALPNLVKQKDEPFYVFGVARGIVRLEDASVIGVLLVNTKVSFLEDICKNMQLTENHRIVILHDNYTIYDTMTEYTGKVPDSILLTIPANTDAKMFPVSIDGVDMLAASVTSDSSGWEIISLIPEAELFSDMNRTLTANILIFTVVMLLSLFLLFIVSRQIVMPINRLVKVMKIAESGDFQARIQVDRKDEIGKLSESYNSLLEKISELIHEVYQQKITASELELQMLQSQINPHFLYNTLESISMMATINGDDTTSEMAANLGSLLRYSISNPNQQVTLGEEIMQLRKYIALQEQRFRSQYTIEITIDQKFYPVSMPKLILQPIVENAIYHGMSSVRSGGKITVTAARTEHDTLMITVTDNGKGMTEEQVNNLNGYINEENELFKSIGMRNVNRRIQLFCGSGYGIHITSAPDEGTTVSVRIQVEFP